MESVAPSWLLPAQRLQQALKILRGHSNYASACAVHIGNEEESDGKEPADFSADRELSCEPCCSLWSWSLLPLMVNPPRTANRCTNSIAPPVTTPACRAPLLAASCKKLSPDSIRTTLDVGSMVQQAAALPPAQKDAIIAYLTRDSALQPAVVVNSQCAPEKQTYSATLRTPHWTGWGNDVTQHRFQSDEQAQLTSDQVSRLKLKWAFGYPNAQNAAAQPTIVNGRLFVGSANGNVYALDAATGCTYWTYNAGFPVRTAISVDEKTNTLYFGDKRTGPMQSMPRPASACGRRCSTSIPL